MPQGSRHLAFAARGAVGAMAMTGVRRVTTGLGLVDQPPPEAVLTQRAPRLLARMSPQRREVAIELAHWAHGAAAGAAFAVVPARLRRAWWSGPAFGLGVQGVFEALVAPALGVEHAPRRPVATRALVALDHVLYGLVLRG